MDRTLFIVVGTAVKLLFLLLLCVSIALFICGPRISEFSGPSLAADPSYLSSKIYDGWGDKEDEIVTFLQVSDTHMNFFDEGVSVKNLDIFQGSVVPAVRPEAVVVTGDLANAKHKSKIPFLGKYSEQREDEWGLYAELTKNARQQTKWMDVRGNHDTFGTGLRCESGDLYSQQEWAKTAGTCAQRVHSFVVEKSFGSYRLVTIDASIEMGPHRPYNFFGAAPKTLIQELRRSIEANGADASKTLLFGHFPSSFVHFEGNKRRTTTFTDEISDITHVSAYFSGHLHSIYDTYLGGLRAFSAHPPALELESPDLWTSSSYRFIAFDHDQFVEQVCRIDHWPIVILTNPMPAGQFSVPGSAAAAAKSSHIRLLVYRRPDTEQSANRQVIIAIDGHEIGGAEGQDGLSRVQWNPAGYAAGTHKLEVYIDGSSEPTLTEIFSIDGSYPKDHTLKKIGEALLSRTNVAAMITISARGGLICCFLLLLYSWTKYNNTTSRLRRVLHLAMTGLVLELYWGFLFVVPGLVPEFGMAYAVFGKIYAGQTSFTSSDPVISFVQILWGVLVPLVFVFLYSDAIPHRMQRMIWLGAGWLFIFVGILRWMLNIGGAYGVFVVLLSPCLFPTAVLAILCAYCTFSRDSAVIPANSERGADAGEEKKKR